LRTAKQQFTYIGQESRELLGHQVPEVPSARQSIGTSCSRNLQELCTLCATYQSKLKRREVHTKSIHQDSICIMRVNVSSQPCTTAHPKAHNRKSLHGSFTSTRTAGVVTAYAPLPNCASRALLRYTIIKEVDSTHFANTPAPKHATKKVTGVRRCSPLAAGTNLRGLGSAIRRPTWPPPQTFSFMNPVRNTRHRISLS